MAIYTVYAPRQAIDAWADAERLVFVRDGFYWWAFLLAPLWMVRHRLWLVLGGYIVVSGVLEVGTLAVGASSVAVAIVGLFISLLVGLEAGTFRRFALRNWKGIGVVSGRDVEEAERRFFDAWLRSPPNEGAVRSAAARKAANTAQWPMPRAASAPDVIGLFPEPGARR